MTQLDVEGPRTAEAVATFPPTAHELARLLAAALVADLRAHPDEPPADEEALEGDNRGAAVESPTKPRPSSRRQHRKVGT